jgi:hypothetical protein
MLLFGKVGSNIFGGETAGESETIDFLSDTIATTLHTATTSFDVDADEAFADVGDEVANGNGYTATTGYPLANKTLTYNASGNKTVMDNTVDPTWTASGAGFAANSAVWRDSTSDNLIGYLPFGSTVTLASGDTLTINLDATNGLWYVTAT